MDNTSITFTLAVVGASATVTDINNVNTSMGNVRTSTDQVHISMDDLVTSLGLAAQPMVDAKTQADDFAKATQASADALVKKTANITTDNIKLGDHIIQLALGKTGYTDYQIALALADAAQLTATANTFDDTGKLSANKDALLAQADVLKTRASLYATAEAVATQKAWETTTKSIGNDLTQALINGWDSGKSAFVIFRDWLVSEFAKLVLSPVINFIVAPLAGAVNSALSSITGGILGNTATGTAAGAAGAAGGTGGGLIGAAGSALGVNASGFTGTGLTGAVGIGASAGAGVTVTGVAGGTAVGTDLGLLGASGAATGGTGAGAAGAAAGGAEGLGGLGAIGVAGLALAAGALLWEWGTSGGRQATELSTVSQPQLADTLTWYQQTSDADGEWFTAHDAAVRKIQFTDNGEIAYQILGDGNIRDVVDAAALTSQYGVAAFADGGNFGGGLRMVGERGPELELTGPSRIFDAQTTASMLRSGGASDSELAAELRLLREEVRGLRASVERGNENTSSAARSLSGQQGVPFLVQVATS